MTIDVTPSSAGNAPAAASTPRTDMTDEPADVAERSAAIRKAILEHPDSSRMATAGEVAAALALVERLARLRAAPSGGASEARLAAQRRVLQWLLLRAADDHDEAERVISALDVDDDHDVEDVMLAAFDDEMRTLLAPLKARRAVDGPPPTPTPVRPI